MEITVLNEDSTIEKLSWDNFNESQGLQVSVERYKAKYGYYPDAVLVGKLYRNQKNLAYCKEHCIRLSGPKLGRPPKGEKKTKAHKKLKYQDSYWIPGRCSHGNSFKSFNNSIIEKFTSTKSKSQYYFLTR